MYMYIVLFNNFMSQYLSYELHNECTRLISRKSRKDIINEVMLLLDENNKINKINKINNNKINKIDNINNDNNLNNNYKNNKVEESLHEIMLIKIIKLIMCLK